MPKSFGLGVGILMLLIGAYTLAWMPAVKKRLAKREQLGERTAEDVRRELKNLKLAVICSFIMGCGLVCAYVFDL